MMPGGASFREFHEDSPEQSPTWKSAFRSATQCHRTRPCNRRRYASIKISAILKPGIGPKAFPIYGGGAADGHTVGPLKIRLPHRVDARSLLTSSLLCYRI